MAPGVEDDEEAQVLSQIKALPRAVVGFWASWQGMSRALVSQVLGAMAADPSAFEALTAIPLDVNKYEDAAFELGVEAPPYFGFYRYGRHISGLTSEDKDSVLEAARSWAAAMDEDGPSPPAAPQANTSSPAASTSLGGSAKKGATDLSVPFELINEIQRGAPLRIFVAGDRSKVGKSSVCLGIMGGLLKIGFQPEDLAYIKPATQCESAQLVTKWCDARGIENRGLGPVIFYKGFTREFLKGNVGTSQDLLLDVDKSVKEIGAGKKVVLVDGVGYPAVGSICGISNADIVATLGCPVVIVGRPGVGDAVDSFNLNACFFTSRGLRVLGGIFNRLPLEGFYSLEACKEAVSAYFRQYQPHIRPYGFVPERPELLNVREEIEAEHANKKKDKNSKAGGEDGGGGGDAEGAAPAIVVDIDTKRIHLAEDFIDEFLEHVDLKQLVRDTYSHERGVGGRQGGGIMPTPSSLLPSPPPPQVVTPPSRLPATAAASVSQAFSSSPLSTTLPATVLMKPPPPPPSSSGVGVVGAKRKTREEIESAAKKQGAKGG